MSRECEADKFNIRLPDGMRDQIRVIAAQNHRSMNSEIIVALERHVSGEVQTKNGPAQE